MSEQKPRHIFLKSQGFKHEATRLNVWDEVDKLKSLLDDDPMSGHVIPGGAGLRKIRMALPGRGKSGGARVIYYQVVDDCVLLVDIYAKNEKDNLSPSELTYAVELREEMLARYRRTRS